MMLGNCKDKFGYYQVGEFKTYNKIEAIELHQRTGIHPHWNFNEEFFKTYDWTREPSASLEELYAARARQIRDTYDYVVLVYSGGADSGNILDTFAENAIPFDEALTYHSRRSHDDPLCMDTAELTKVAYPKLKYWHDKGVRFKHRDIDLTDIILQSTVDKSYRLDRAYYQSTHFGFHHVATTYFREIIPDYQKIIESGRKLVLVWGTDKPRIYFENQKFALKFLDIVDDALRNRTQMLGRDNEYDELFYWAPESADMICKQGHTLMKFLKQYHEFVDVHETGTEDDSVKGYVNEHQGRLKNLPRGLGHLAKLAPRNLYNLLTYKNFDPNMFSVGKNPCLVLSPREKAFQKHAPYQQQQQIMIQHLSTLDNYWWLDPSNILRGLKLCVSPTYYLEK